MFTGEFDCKKALKEEYEGARRKLTSHHIFLFQFPVLLCPQTFSSPVGQFGPGVFIPHRVPVIQEANTTQRSLRVKSHPEGALLQRSLWERHRNLVFSADLRCRDITPSSFVSAQIHSVTAPCRNLSSFELLLVCAINCR